MVQLLAVYTNPESQNAQRHIQTALSGIAVQHANDSYSRRGNFGGSLVHSMFLMYSPDDPHSSKAE